MITGSDVYRPSTIEKSSCTERKGKMFQDLDGAQPYRDVLIDVDNRKSAEC